MFTRYLHKMLTFTPAGDFASPDFRPHASANISFNHLNAELNPICHLLALLGAHPILHIGRIRVNRLYSLCIIE